MFVFQIDTYSTNLTMPKSKERLEDSDSEELKSSNSENKSTSDEEPSKKSKGKKSNGENEVSQSIRYAMLS